MNRLLNRVSNETPAPIVLYMKSNLNVLKSIFVSLVLLMLLSSQLCAAKSELTAVLISPAVSEQIQKASPDERKKMEAAISQGNKFIPHHFDGSAYDAGDTDDEQELKYWLKNIRPLINRDITKWYNNTDISQITMESLKIVGLPKHISASDVAVCPQIELVSIEPVHEHFDVIWKTYYPVSFVNDSYVLKYRAKTIGVLNFSMQPPTEFFLDNENNFVAVLISIDKANKVNQVVPQYQMATSSAKHYIEILTRYISGVWSHNATAIEKIKMKQLVVQIKEDEARVCASTAVISKLPLIKE